MNPLAKHTLPVRCLRRPNRRGISMMESVVAMTILTTAGAAVLTSIGSTIAVSDHSARELVARGLAEQLMDEIEAARFPQATNEKPVGTARSGFDDIDDYHKWSSRPPVTKEGFALGTDGQPNGSRSYRLFHMQPDPLILDGYTREVLVEPVEPTENNSNPWTVVTTSSDYRRVTVTVSRTSGLGTTELAVTTRIFSHVPTE